MMRIMTARALLIMLSICGFAACGVEYADGQRASESNLASCEAKADHRMAQCPDARPRRLFDIQACERERGEHGPTGCDRAFADYVLCQTHAPIDCTGEVPSCREQLQAVNACEARFVQQTFCLRASHQDATACAGTGRYGFTCGSSLPQTCASASGPIACCDSFSTQKPLFVDPLLEPNELPPDYSMVDFSAIDQCLDFTDGQRWGRCDESSRCACTHCSAELAACASEYSCLFGRGCELGTGGCDPNVDPYFTGYGASTKVDKLEMCMTQAQCTPKCQ